MNLRLLLGIERRFERELGTVTVILPLLSGFQYPNINTFSNRQQLETQQTSPPTFLEATVREWQPIESGLYSPPTLNHNPSIAFLNLCSECESKLSAPRKEWNCCLRNVKEKLEAGVTPVT